MSVSYFFNYNWYEINIFALLGLFLISLIDDIRNIGALYRLITHFLCIFTYVHFTLLEKVNLEEYINKAYLIGIIYMLLIIGTTWFINAFNFMDGIDGISTIQVLFLTSSSLFFNLFLGLENNILHFCILGVSLGFLLYNWHPAKIFLGDSGSIPLGFLMLCLLVDLCIKGYWVASIILPLYYILDTSLTLLNRVIKRERFWHPHSQHFYQKAIRNGQSHKNVCLKIILLSIGLFIFSLLSVLEKNNFIFLVLSIFWCLFFLLNLSTSKKTLKNDTFN
ncbi:hypothetical protein OA264_01515 [Alphaproteobacteria bacterium]|nr:hypothetical protein [Alphaproteobacteria bacterium]